MCFLLCTDRYATPLLEPRPKCSGAVVGRQDNVRDAMAFNPTGDVVDQRPVRERHERFRRRQRERLETHPLSTDEYYCLHRRPCLRGDLHDR
jgi:hypothetical protein